VITAPTKIFEAMAAGIPVIANKEFPALEKIIVENNAGIIVNCNIDDITNGLEKLIKNKKLRSEMGKNGRLAVEREYTWENQVKNLIGLYKEIFNNTK
jgi:glycosyltransferase involved in cell wall biosynthesis